MRKLLVTLLMCVLASCAGSKSKVKSANEPPKPPENAWSWIPETSTTVGHLELEELRKTQLWPLWAEVHGEQKLASWVPVEKVLKVTFGGSGTSREDLSYVAALEGVFEPNELQQLAERDHVTAEQRGLLKIYRRPEGYWTQIAQKLIVVCTPDRIDGLVDRASLGDGVAVKEAALWKSLAQRVGAETAHISLLASDPGGTGRALIDKQAAKYGLGSFAQDASKLGVGIEVGTEYRMVAVAETPDEFKASAATEQVKQSLDTIANNFFVRMLGAGALLSKVRVSNNQNYLFVRAIVSEVDFNNVLERVRSALSLANGAGSLGELQ